jgi:hypothetical protein
VVGYETTALATFVASGTLDVTVVVLYAHVSRVRVEPCLTYATVTSADGAIADERVSIANWALAPHADPATVEGFGERGQAGGFSVGSHAAWTSLANQYETSCPALL